MKLTAYDGTELNAINIIASYHPEREKRVIYLPTGIHDLLPTTIAI